MVIVLPLKVNMDRITVKKLETEAEMLGKAYVHHKAWHEAYSGIIDRSYLDEMTLGNCESIARKWPDNIIIAMDDEKVVGFVGYGKYHDDELPDAGEIYSLYILSEYYGAGVGAQLMRAALDELKAYDLIALWVLKDNRRAIRFYEKCGFCADGSEKKITLGSPVAEIRMTLGHGITV